MEIDPTGGAYAYESRPQKTPTQTLDKDAFMQILVNQLRYQNPLSPQDSDSFINQIVQLSMVEQITNLTTSMERMIGAEELNRAVGLIGYHIEALNALGEPVEGIVQKVIMKDGAPVLVIKNGLVDNERVEMDKLLNVSAPFLSEPEAPAPDEGNYDAAEDSDENSDDSDDQLGPETGG